MKKKFIVSSEDKKDWIDFTKETGDITFKKDDLLSQDKEIKRVQKIDLHGISLIEANRKVEKFIVKSYKDGYKKLLIVTGKGSRSSSHDNPYISEKLSTLKYSVPEYINNNENLIKKIKKISTADLKDGGEGAIYVYLKKFTK